MKVVYKAAFFKDLEKAREQRLRDAVAEIIEQIKHADNLPALANVKKLQGSTHYYRIRVGDYRLGFSAQDDTVTFIRFLHRKDIYRYFP